ncbi:TetR family transcriptional regulator C-terminal domain-containing protein [Microbacterium sp. KKR3/1]|uniref:TetR/AcrR family transcriptional regulator n=1 Tax=Microbacterium sp. KKR3/1 TaxID=2904241 RepID=UPI001E2956FC|nr:TetR family transcriptional regulator C-terminal domain-containing protein [Microbacterium sp. KKR3/1]MCE0510092.1 TetR family transcriptional regulator C-terminal domain-containing protein [Microbacterium sp. KKR3/1]
MKITSRSTAPRRMPPEERERSIVDGAIALAREGGLEVLTVRAVAARVGVTPALVAHYRPVMDAFVAEIFGYIVAAERDEVIAAFDGVGDIRAGLHDLIETLLDGERDDVTLIWVQAWALGARNDILAARVRSEMDGWQSALEQIFVRAAAAGVIADGRSDTAAWLLLAMVDGMNAHSLVKWAPSDRADLARRALSAVLDSAAPHAISLASPTEPRTEDQ